MLNTLMPYDMTPICKEGDLYKELHIFGRTFEIFYGYYEEREREDPTIDPMPIYPDFLKDPQYTAEGIPFVTKMQDACKYYNGKNTSCNECAECIFYRHGDDFIGACICTRNRLQEK